MAARSRTDFSYSAIWEDAAAMIRAEAPLLIAVAGVFLVLPDLFVAHFLPRPETSDSNQMIALLVQYFTENWVVLLAAGAVGAIGMIAMLLLLLDRGRPTVAAAIVAAPALLLSYLAAGLLSNMIIFAGTVALILPGVYLFGRLALAGTVVVAERRLNPIEALRRAFDLTEGLGWRMAGLLLAVIFAALLITYAVSAVLGSIFLFVAGASVGGLLALIVQSVAAAALEIVLLGLYASIYRRLA